MLVGQTATAAPKGVKKGAAIDAEPLEESSATNGGSSRSRTTRSRPISRPCGQYDEAEA
jgi:hypothetical protein